MGVQEAAIGAVMPYLVIGALVIGAAVWYRREIGGAAAAVGEAGQAVVDAATGAGEDVVRGYTESGKSVSHWLYGDPAYDYEAAARAREKAGPPTGALKEFYDSLQIAGPSSPGYPTGIPSMIQPGAVENLAAAGKRIREEARFKGVSGGISGWFENLDKIVKIWG